MVLLASAAGAAAPTISEYHAGITARSGPSGVAGGPDGNLWFTESGNDEVAKITPAGVVTEYRAGNTAESGPEGIAAGPDGNLWFTEFTGDRIGKITPAGVVTEYRAGITPGSGPWGIAAGPDGNVWFTENLGDMVAKITPAGVVTEYGAEVTVNVTVKGKGRVTGGGISCPARCKTTIASGAKLTLRASAARGYRFAGWSGACRGLHACTLRPKAAVKITATFRRRHRSARVVTECRAGITAGSSPSGITASPPTCGQCGAAAAIRRRLAAGAILAQ